MTRPFTLRWLGAALALAATLSLSATPVIAGGGPVRYAVTPVGLSFDLPAPDYCAAPMRIETIVSREYEMDFQPHPDGTVTAIVSGSLVARVTNMATGQSLDVNASGPGQFTTYLDGSGRYFQEGHTLDFGVGRGIRLIDGRFDLNSMSVRGTTTDICKALGG